MVQLTNLCVMFKQCAMFKTYAVNILWFCLIWQHMWLLVLILRMS